MSVAQAAGHIDHLETARLGCVWDLLCGTVFAVGEAIV